MKILPLPCLLHRATAHHPQHRPIVAALLLVLLLLVQGMAHAATKPLPKVAIHVSELTRALENMTAEGGTPTGPGMTGKQWWYSSWRYSLGPDSLKEAFRSDGTPFVTVSDSDIIAGALLYPDGSPRYPILISITAEAIADEEITPLDNYVKAGGFVFAGASSFTRDTTGGYRSDFALAAQMGLHRAQTTLSVDNNWNWYQNGHLQKALEHRLVSHLPNGTLEWMMPLRSDEISWGTYAAHFPNPTSWFWQVIADGATVLATGDLGPLLTARSHGLGQFLFYGAIQPLLGHGVTDPSTHAYFIFRNAVQWAFESFGLPIVKVSPWRYQHDAALIVRHDMEEYIDRIRTIPASAAYEQAKGIKGEYYFCTGALREYTDLDKDAIIAGLQTAVSDAGALIGTHNGGLGNPNSAPTDHTYWHWGPDEMLDLTIPGYASGKAFALTSVSNSFADLEGWLAGRDNGRAGCGVAGNCPKVWSAPYFNSTREGSDELLQQVGIVAAGEQKIGPLPHFTLSYDKPDFRYPQVSIPTSDWFVSGFIPQALEWGHTPASLRAAIDFYAANGGLINFYGHQPSSGGGIEQDYVDYSATKAKLWSTNSVDIFDWWTLRAPVQVAPAIDIAGYDYDLTANVSGASDPATAVEIALPHAAGTTVANLQVYRDGLKASAPTDYRETGSGLKVLVGATVSDVNVTFSLYPDPVGIDDSFTVEANTYLQQAAPGLLANDTPQVPSLTAQVVAPPTHGTLQLEADGSFRYQPATGYVGSDSFTYRGQNVGVAGNAATVNLTVTRAAPVLTWNAPAAITYGTPLSATQLSASANIPGEFVYTPGVGTLLGAGKHTLSVTFTPTDGATYLPATMETELTVDRAAPTLSWDTPAAIVYGTRLGTAQLNATSTLAGTFVYSPPAGTIPDAGSHILQVTFTPTDSTNYATRTETRTLSVAKATPTISWSAPAAIGYGTRLGATELNATASVPGTFTYAPVAGTLCSAGITPLTVTFTPTDSTNFEAATASTTIAVTKASPALAWGAPAPIGYGTPLGAAQLDATAATTGNYRYDPPAGTVLTAGKHSLSVTFTPTDSTNFLSQTTTTSLTVDKAKPVLSWLPQGPLSYGTPLGPAQLNASANMAGSFGYLPAAGAVLTAGTQTISVTFTPTDTGNFTTATAAASISVTKAKPSIVWSAPASIGYGTRLGTMQLNATANASGTFSYSPGVGTLLNAGVHTLTATFTPDDIGNVEAQTAVRSITVAKGTPTIAWNAPSAIVYGTPLGVGQLNATANIEGSFAYTPGSGTVLAAGNHALKVTFTPNDGANYQEASATTPLTVEKATPVVTWNAPGAIVYGISLGVTQLNATANLPGTLVYTPVAGTVLNAGTQQLLVTFTPSDTANYAPVTKAVQLAVAKATPVVSWVTPAALTYGTPLGVGQLNATANIEGSFAYTPGSGTILSAGNHALKVTFTPNDSANYQEGSTTTSLTVEKATPVVTWNAPGAITYGISLGVAQLNATANQPGTFAYTPVAGTVLNAGTQQLLVTFTPSDTANYAPVTKAVQLAVAKATPVVSWVTPAAISYGTALGSTQLNAASDIAGSFSYRPAAGTVLAAGNQPLSVSFTPTDGTNYLGVSSSTNLVVHKAVPAVTWETPAAISYGTPLGAEQLAATANVAGSFSYDPPAGTVINSGSRLLSTTFTPADTGNFEVRTASVALTINKGDPLLSWIRPDPISYGAPLGAAQLNAQSTVPGTFSYLPTAGTILNAGSHTLTASFIPNDSGNYQTKSATVTLSIDKAKPVITWASPAPIGYGTALDGNLLNASANRTGSFSYAPGAGTVLPAGTHLVTATFTPEDSANYLAATATATLQVRKGVPELSWSTPAAITYGTPLGSDELRASASVPGAFSYAPATGTVLDAGSHTLVATFVPDDSANYESGGSATVSIDVSPASPTLAWGAVDSVSYGTRLGTSQLNASASVPGTFAYNPPAGTLPNAGVQGLSVTFTPTDGINYRTRQASNSLTVTKAVPVVSWQPPAAIDYPAPLGPAQLNATAATAGTFSYSPAAGSVLPPGTASLEATFTPADSANYLPLTKSVEISVTLPSFTVLFSTDGQGTVSGILSQNVKYGGVTSSVQALPSLGYHFLNWSGTGGFAGSDANPLIIGNVTANQSVTANFVANRPNGDLNGDGVADIIDALLALRIAAKLDRPSQLQLQLGDVAPLVLNKPQQDGVIDVGDVIVILRKAVGRVNWQY